MTLNDIIRSAQSISRLLSSGDIPLLYNGNEADYTIVLNPDTMKAELFITEKK